MTEVNDDYIATKTVATVERLTASLEQPDKFARIFCDAVKTQKTMDDALKDVMRNLMKHDKDARYFIKEIVKEFEKESLWASTKKFGFAIWTLFVAAFGVIISPIITHLLK